LGIVKSPQSTPIRAICPARSNQVAEIVVPIYAHGKVIGEIDIDSHDPAAFTE
jgi:L-methionine (R)-S-oxide reductase